MYEVFITESVSLFSKSLELKTKAKLVHEVDLLKTYGSLLKMPHSKKITNNLYELRIRGKQEVRIFYCIKNEKIFLLHGFLKKTQKIPRKEITTAEARIKLLAER